MSPKKRTASSVSVVQVVAMIALLLMGLIGLAFLFVPRKPIAPPPSRITYESRPEEKKKTYPQQSEFDTETPEPSTTLSQPSEEEVVPAETVPTVEIHLSGKVVDANTRQPIKDAQIKVSVKTASEDTVAFASLVDTRRRRMQSAMHKHQTKSDAEGLFSINLTEPGVYVVHIKASGYIPYKAITEMLNEDRLTFHIEALLSVGASVSGKVMEAGSKRGIPGLRVQIDSSDAESAISDSDGRYELKGLAPGQYGIAVDLRGSPYMAGTSLPFQRVTITSADQKLENVDFVVEAAGVVWGYVLSPNQEPINQAQVILTSSQSLIAQAISNLAKKSAPIADMTSEDGYYELTGVPLNQEWRVHAMSQAYAPQLSETFFLSPAQRNVRIDIYMFSGSNVSGQVVTQDGKPVPGAEVICIPAYGRFFSSMTAPQAFRNSTSDDKGLFAIRELPAGEYQLFAQKRGYKVSPVGYPLYPDGYNEIKNVKLVLTSAEEGAYSVYGQTVDDRGIGIDGVELQLVGVAMGGLEGIERTTTSANNGRFQFDGVNSGQYTLIAKKDGYSPTTVRRVRLNEETRVLMRQTALVRGRVIVKATNQPPSLYEVTAYPISESTGSINILGMTAEALRSETFSNPDGSFELSMNAGTYRLEASAEKYTPARQEIKLEAGQVLEGIVLILDEKGGTISGTVYAADGGNVQGASVMLLEASSPAEALVMLAANAVPDNRVMRVGSDGTFTFENLPAGEFVAIAQHPNYPNAQSPLIVLEEGGKEDNVRIRFSAGGALEGYVYSDGRPLAGAVVVVVGNGITEHSTTDTSGYYYIDGLATGIYQAMVTDVSSGDLTSIYGTRGVQVTVEEGSITRYDFGTREGARIEGRCMPGPMNMLGGRAVLQRPGFSQAALGQTVDVTQLMGQSVGINPVGTFVMEDVMPGEWQLDIYYFELGINNPLEVRYVHSELIQVEQGQVLPLDIFVSY